MMKIKIVRERQGVREPVEFDSRFCKNDSPVALDVLLDAQRESLPDLSYRYGCRNELCGVCTIEVNGQPRLSCRTKIKEGDELAPLSTLPVVKDLINDREKINKLLRGKLNIPTKALAEQDASQSKVAPKEIDNLNKCNECYACLTGCPLHEKNDLDSEAYSYGNPYVFLKIQKQILDPAADQALKEEGLGLAQSLGLDDCVDCMKCQCHEGIHLPREVIAPLLKEKER